MMKPRDQPQERAPANRTRQAELYETVRAATWPTCSLRALGRVQAALTTSPHGEGLTWEIPADAAGLGLHLSGPQHTAARYEGEPWRDYVDRRGAVTVLVPGRPAQSVGVGVSQDLHVLLSSDLLRSVSLELGIQTRSLELRSIFAASDDTATHLLTALAKEVAAGGPGGRLYTEGVASALAVHLLRHYSSARFDRAARQPEATSGDPGGVRQALEFIREHLTSDLSLASIARAAQLSERHLSRLFRAATGLSLHQYVIEQRVNQAQNLLRRTDLTVAQVAVSCGFAHHQHLGRHFKRLTGASPEQYRRDTRC
ncbi:helix-turn-helix domain-containing protein [Deinococcus sp. HMF7620]|uniref:Helix-turn-helix domain-containing protein n=1 Tax=Deinococcus arboris TaxID=2682977 RepID=A0A7C9HTA8_9DEIO|nr:AraC family transcriptional regulator [Deinococcus arboris]MVN88247.1 helix-turn-helix domain-containing protein [Deinococcus arboris]